jgi:phospholipase/carboxylesterase/glyoxalase family protein
MSEARGPARDPHHGQRIVAAGLPLEQARAAMILVHGRGATAESILGLARELDRPGFAYLAPQASGYTWYPYSFLAPLAQNEPFLGSALGLVATAVQQVIDAGVPADRLMLLGFSQGACLTLEFTARNPRRYGGVAGLTGGLIGPDDTPRDYPGSLDGTRVFLGSSDPDPHVPVARVEETARVLERMGAQVTTRIYPGRGHTVNEDELEHVRAMMDEVLGRAAPA